MSHHLVTEEGQTRDMQRKRERESQTDREERARDKGREGERQGGRDAWKHMIDCGKRY